MKDAVNVAKVGFYDWNIIDDEFSLSEQFQNDWGLESGATLSDAFELVVPEDRERVQALIEKAMAEGIDYSAEYRIVRPTDGKIVWIHAKGSVSFDEGGQPQRFFGTSIDISAQKAIEESLEEARILADRANSAKSSFLANMSHELRSPLGTIIGFTELLKGKNLSRQDAENFMSVIDRNSQHLLTLLDDILDLAKVEAEKMIIESVSFSLIDLLNDFASQMQ
ncbi:MAG: PAS domain-containing protein, partial [Pseudobdellovibrionaceae bacterium]|nr:PAS domain-containing protein [Pseudobdellovibrionaceae bacterium]